MRKYLFQSSKLFQADVLHWFIPQENIIESFVVEDPDHPGTLTDFVSFYTLPSTVMNHPQHNSIKVRI